MNFPSGFDNWKDICDVIVIPIAAVLFATILPTCQEFTRRETFKRIISRELHEIEPQPEKMVVSKLWHSHLEKQGFIHQRILSDPTGNRDFILSLDPDQIYLLGQLWSHTDRGQKCEENQQENQRLQERESSEAR